MNCVMHTVSKMVSNYTPVIIISIHFLLIQLYNSLVGDNKSIHSFINRHRVFVVTIHNRLGLVLSTHFKVPLTTFKIPKNSFDDPLIEEDNVMVLGNHFITYKTMNPNSLKESD